VNDFVDMLFNGDLGLMSGGPQVALLALLLAFCIGHIIGWVYMWTHGGLSYSQMFTASLLVMPVLIAMVMMLMSGSIALAFGMFAVFAVVRFRNVLKDTRDTTFVIWAIVEGAAVGTRNFSTALVGALFIGAVFIYMRMTSFGGRHRYDVILSLRWSGPPIGDGERLAPLAAVLRRHSVRAELASQRELDGDIMDLSYQLQMRDPARSPELMRELEGLKEVGKVSLYHREDESEV
jgi:hypothetical protein